MTSAALAMAAPARHAVMAPITTTSGCLRFRLIVWRGAKTPLAGMSNGKRAYMSSRKRHSSAFTSDDSIPDSTESLSATSSPHAPSARRLKLLEASGEPV